jgi:hypothetical protein
LQFLAHPYGNDRISGLGGAGNIDTGNGNDQLFGGTRLHRQISGMNLEEKQISIKPISKLLIKLH